MDKLTKLRDTLLYNMPPGGPLIPFRYIVNLYKVGMLPLCLILMHYYNNEQNKNINNIFTFMYGSYGICWIYKELTFPDAIFMRKINLINIFSITGILFAYNYIAYMRISHATQDIPDNQTLVALFMYIFGVVLILTSDCQKYYTLKYKQGLISEGCFNRSRNTNYLGEMMIYCSYVLTLPSPKRWIGWGILGFVWLSIFAMNMVLKDHNSLSKKEGWDEYVKTSGLLFPIIIQSNKKLDNVLFLVLVLGVGFMVGFLYI